MKYRGIHMWATRTMPATRCEECGITTGALHHANVSGEYKRQVSDWRILCVPCHSDFDGNTIVRRSDEPRLVEMRDRGMTFTQIAEVFGVTRKAISKRYYRITKPCTTNK